MNDCVSKESLKKWQVYSTERKEYVVPVNIINMMQTIEVQPVVWGEWIIHDSGAGDISYECNVCKEISCCRANFCPDCGANMQREDEQA